MQWSNSEFGATFNELLLMREVWFSLATRQPFAAECPSGSSVHDWRITSECGTNRNAARHHQQHATRTQWACAREDHTQLHAA
jgi:hypothetical protein